MKQISANIKRGISNKFALGFTGVAATAIISSVGLVSAHAATQPSRADCDRAGFSNYGQCTKEWAHARNHPGGGYGGNTVNLNLNHSNGNVIKIILNFFS